MNLTVTDFIRKDNTKSVQGKLYPSGRFSVVQIFRRKKKRMNYGKQVSQAPQGMRTVQQLDDAYSKLVGGDFSPLREVSPSQADDARYVGLSDEAISPIRKNRGSKGINSGQRDILCWGAATLERVYGRANLSFLTLTLPPLTPPDLDSVRQNWADIVHRVLLRIKEKLNEQGITTSVAGCVELQLERYHDTGFLYPHLHLVFRGRRDSHTGWGIKPHQFRLIWRRCVSKFLSQKGHDWRASENVQQVRKSVAGYLAKYVSKCASKSEPGILDTWHPRDWIILSRQVRRLYQRMCHVGTELGTHLDSVVRVWQPGWGYHNAIYISSPAYGERRIGYCGWLKGEERYPSYADLHFTDNVGRKAGECASNP